MKHSKVIPIFFTFDRNYCLAAAVAFHSLLTHASRDYEYRLYVLHDTLSEAQQRRLQKVVNGFPNARLQFKDVSAYDTGWDKLRNKSHFSKEIYFKLTAPDMFPEYDRMLFSDVDVIFTGDISPSFGLFENEDFYFAGTLPIMENKGLAAYKRDFTPEEISTISQYEISAGFMLLNLKQMRQDKVQEKLTAFFHDNIWRLRLPEQDCIALCLAPRVRFLDYKYVVCGFQFDEDPSTIVFNPNNPALQDRQTAIATYKKMLRETVQLHYPGPLKPWNSFPWLVPQYGKWLKVCKAAGQTSYYAACQPLFIIQRLKRYNLKRFVGKLANKIFPHGRA